MGGADFSLSASAQRTLLTIARQTLERGLSLSPEKAWEQVRPPGAQDPSLSAVRPCFVTLTQNKRLRGCIGATQGRAPLPQEVCAHTLHAALRDPRFPPVTASEVGTLRIGISVLGPLFPFDPATFQLGAQGLVAQKGGQLGLLLARVAEEWKWDLPEFIRQTHHKAGLSFPDPLVELQTFFEMSFSED